VRCWTHRTSCRKVVCWTCDEFANLRRQVGI